MAKCSTGSSVTTDGVTIDDLVKRYLKERKPKFDSDLERCSNIENVLKHPHQYRLPRVVKKEIIEKMKKNGLLTNPYSSFEEIYDDVDKLVGRGKYLTKYDAALRIGNSKNIFPEKYCYLSRGAKEGLVWILEKIIEMGVDVALRKVFEMLMKKTCPLVILLPCLLDVLFEYFPALKKLPLMYLEDFLCVYKDEIKKAKK